jgi:hypothetical protein
MREIRGKTRTFAGPIVGPATFPGRHFKRVAIYMENELKSLRAICEAASKETPRAALAVRLAEPWIAAAQRAGASWRDISEAMSPIYPRLLPSQLTAGVRIRVAHIRARRAKARVDLLGLRAGLALRAGVDLPAADQLAVPDNAASQASTIATLLRALDAVAGVKRRGADDNPSISATVTVQATTPIAVMEQITPSEAGATPGARPPKLSDLVQLAESKDDRDLRAARDVREARAKDEAREKEQNIAKSKQIDPDWGKIIPVKAK